MVGGMTDRKEDPELECVFHVIDPGLLALGDADLDDVKSPGKVTGSQTLQPGIRAALDQSLFVLAHRIETADPASFAAGFDFHKKQQLAVPGDDVDLATPWPAVISGEDFAALGAEPGAGNPLAEVADPDPVTRLAVRCRQSAG